MHPFMFSDHRLCHVSFCPFRFSDRSPKSTVGWAFSSLLVRFWYQLGTNPLLRSRKRHNKHTSLILLGLGMDTVPHPVHCQHEWPHYATHPYTTPLHGRVAVCLVRRLAYVFLARHHTSLSTQHRNNVRMVDVFFFSSFAYKSNTCVLQSDVVWLSLVWNEAHRCLAYVLLISTHDRKRLLHKRCYGCYHMGDGFCVRYT